MDYDEELYVASNMVIWSKGSKTEASAAYKAFSVDSPVLQVRADSTACLLGSLCVFANSALRRVGVCWGMQKDRFW